MAPPQSGETLPTRPPLPRQSVSITDLIMATANVEKEAPPVIRAPSVPISSLIHSEDVPPSRRVFRSNTQKSPAVAAGLQILSDAAAGLLELRKENHHSISASSSLTVERETDKDDLHANARNTEAEVVPVEDVTMVVDPPTVVVSQADDPTHSAPEEPSQALMDAKLSPVHDTHSLDDNVMNLDLHTLGDSISRTGLMPEPSNAAPTEKQLDEPVALSPSSSEQPVLLLDGLPLPESPPPGKSDEDSNPLPDITTPNRSPPRTNNDDVSVSSSLTSTPNPLAVELSSTQSETVISTPSMKNDALASLCKETTASEMEVAPEPEPSFIDGLEPFQPSPNLVPVTPPSVAMDVDLLDASKDSSVQATVNIAPVPPSTSKVKLSLRDFALRKKRQREEREEVEAREAREREEHGAKEKESEDGSVKEQEANQPEEGMNIQTEEDQRLPESDYARQTKDTHAQDVPSSTPQTDLEKPLSMENAAADKVQVSIPVPVPSPKLSSDTICLSSEPPEPPTMDSLVSSESRKDGSSNLVDCEEPKKISKETLDTHQSTALMDRVELGAVVSPRNIDVEMQDSIPSTLTGDAESKPPSTILLDNQPRSQDHHLSDPEFSRPRVLPLNGHDTNVAIPTSQATKFSSIIPAKNDIPDSPPSVRQIPTKPRMTSASPTVDTPMAQNANIKSSLSTSPLNSSSPKPMPSKTPSGPASYPRRASTSSVHEDGEIVVSSGPPTAPKSTYYRPHTPTPPTQPRSFSLNAGSPGGRYNGSSYVHSPPGYSQSSSGYARSYIPPSSRAPPSGPRALMRAPGRGPPRGPSADWDRDRDRDRTWYGSARPRGRGRP
jgi:hypothetical protein